MSRIVLYVLAFFIFIHGMIHLMGFVAYWPLAEIGELPYKTTLLGGRWDLGSAGMRIYILLWLAAALIFGATVVGLVTQQAWWWPLMWVAVLLSLLICILDWGNAFRGAIISGVILLGLIVLLGLRVQPALLASYPQQSPALATMAIPGDLPVPVARYYETIVDEELPLVETAVISGRGTLRFNGIPFPAQYRLVHDVGHDYRQYFTATYFGRPLMAADERYIDGRATLDTPMGLVENDPMADSAANQALWGIAMMMPSAYLDDSRVRWEAIDEYTARLIVPFGAEEQEFTVNFDPDTGLIAGMDTLRYYDAQQGKRGWHLEGDDWQSMHGFVVPRQWSITWEGDETPWLVGGVEEMEFNVDVAAYLAAGEESLAGKTVPANGN